MLTLRASEIASIAGGQLHGNDVTVRGLSTDTRTLARGALFCAITGPTFDGNDFLAAARDAGAAAALATRAADDLPTVVVDESLPALHALVASWRARFDARCVGITGSNGKTTVKEMLARILGKRGHVLATQGNLNNHIGVPLTLSRLDATHAHMVVEMGANHIGEIAMLAALARPEVGVITLIAPAHLEGFGSVEGVARAKGEMIASLPAHGTAVVNGDGPFQSLWRDLAGTRRLLRFGFSDGVDVRVEHRAAPDGSELVLHTPIGEQAVRLPLVGQHNAANAAAAAAAAIALDVDLATVAAGLAEVTPVKGRLMPLRGVDGVRVIDDTYNANPTSLKVALDVLSASTPPRWLVLGDMAELGDDAESAHHEAGVLARSAGVERVWCTGTLSRGAASSFGAGAEHFDDVRELIKALLDALDPAATLLVKGSRSAGMERVVAALVNASAEGRAQCC